jgi:CDP-diacylglycerol--glycerol-3-phosphate 3-phosphatidyltransferase
MRAVKAMSVANRLTVLRIILAAGTFAALLQKHIFWHAVAFLFFVAALLTDWFDGRIARLTHTISPFGKVVDPIADKILVIGTLIALIRTGLKIPLWGIFLIVARELLMGGLRVLAAKSGQVMEAERWGKLKMGVQSASILVMLIFLVVQDYAPIYIRHLEYLPYFLTVLCVISAWSSAYFYFKRSRRLLEKSWS